MNAKSKRIRFIILAIALVAVLMTATAALAAEVTARPVFWSSDLGGHLKIAGASHSGLVEGWVQPGICQDIEDCLTSGLVHPHGVLVVLALHDHKAILTGQALVEQIQTFLADCDNGDMGDNDVFATGPDDLFPTATIEICPAPGLINLQSATVILAPYDHGMSLTKQALVEQMRTFTYDCHESDTGDVDAFATGPDDLFPPAGIKDCPTIIRLPHRPH